MSRYVQRRLLQFPFILFAVATVVFLVMHAIGNPARLLLNPEGTFQDLAKLEAALGLDQPLYVQYGHYLVGLVHGDFGNSFRYHQPALPLVLDRLPATLLLTGAALIVMVPFALAMGMLAATHRNTPVDYLATAIA